MIVLNFYKNVVQLVIGLKPWFLLANYYKKYSFAGPVGQPSLLSPLWCRQFRFLQGENCGGGIHSHLFLRLSVPGLPEDSWDGNTGDTGIPRTSHVGGIEIKLTGGSASQTVITKVALNHCICCAKMLTSYNTFRN